MTSIPHPDDGGKWEMAEHNPLLSMPGGPLYRRRKPVEPILLSVTDVALLLGISRSTVYELATRGDLPSVKIGGSRRFRRSSIETWLASKERGR